MILKNKLTRERLQLSYTEFQVKFAKEIQTALESCIKTENAKPYFKTNKTQNRISTLTYIGILIILECRTGISKECNFEHS